MSSLALTSSWYYICTSYCIPDNTGVILTYLIHARQVKNISTSTLVFNISQFFLLLNYQLLLMILDKASFDSKISFFFQNYLVSRKTKYFWNNFSSPLFNVDIGVEQDSILSPILSALYLSPIFHIFEKRLKKSKKSDFCHLFCRRWSFCFSR